MFFPGGFAGHKAGGGRNDSGAGAGKGLRNPAVAGINTDTGFADFSNTGDGGKTFFKITKSNNEFVDRLAFFDRVVFDESFGFEELHQLFSHLGVVGDDDIFFGQVAISDDSEKVCGSIHIILTF